MKRIVKILGVLGILLIGLNTFVSAGASVHASDLEDQLLFESDVTTTSEDQSRLKLLLSDVEKYIDFNGDKFFNVENALANNESQDVIAIGEAYNDMLNDERQGNIGNINRKKRAIINGLSHYGNWCGKGNNGKKPIDVLDEQCKKHDKCYESNGQWNSECDKQLVWNIAKNFGAINKIGWHARTYAVAAIVLFAGKVGGTALLKQQFPALAPFLP